MKPTRRPDPSDDESFISYVGPDDSCRLVTYEDAVTCFGPELVAQIMSYVRHHNSDAGPIWFAAELQEIADLVAIETAGGPRP